MTILKPLPVPAGEHRFSIQCATNYQTMQVNYPGWLWSNWNVIELR